MKIKITEALYANEIFVGQMEHVPQVGDYVDKGTRRYEVFARFFDLDTDRIRVSVKEVS